MENVVEDMDEYIKTKDLESVFKAVLVQCLRDRPENPIAFTANYLKETYPDDFNKVAGVTAAVSEEEETGVVEVETSAAPATANEAMEVDTALVTEGDGEDDEGGLVVTLSHPEDDASEYLGNVLAFADLIKFMGDKLVDERPKDPLKFLINMLKDAMGDGVGGNPEDDYEEIEYDDDEEEDEDNIIDDDALSELQNQKKRSVMMNRTRRPSVSAECSTVGDGGVPSAKLKSNLSPDDKERVLKAVNDNILFKDIDPRVLPLMVTIVFEINQKAGSTIVRQGDDGENYYIVKEGVCDIVVSKGGTLQVVGKLEPDNSFGELALMYNSPRAATIKANTDVTLWCIDRTSFQKLLSEKTNSTRRLHEGFLANVPILSTLTNEQRSKLSDSLQTSTFAKGESIITQGDKGDDFFILEDGAAVAKVRVADGSDIEVKKYAPGDYFGELALLTDKPRAASIIATEDHTRAVYMDRMCFKRLMGSCETLLRKNTEMYEKVLKEMLE